MDSESSARAPWRRRGARVLRVATAGFLLLGLSACPPNQKPAAPATEQDGITVIFIGNPMYTVNYVGYWPVTFEGERDTSRSGSFETRSCYPQQALAGTVCVMLGTRAGRYRLISFTRGHRGWNNNAETQSYDLAERNAFGWPKPGTGTPFVQPPGRVGYAGSFAWDHAPPTLSDRLGFTGQKFTFEPGAKPSEREVLTALLADTLFRDELPNWAGLLQGRLDHLGGTAAPKKPTASPSRKKTAKPAPASK